MPTPVAFVLQWTGGLYIHVLKRLRKACGNRPVRSGKERPEHRLVPGKRFGYGTGKQGIGRSALHESPDRVDRRRPNVGDDLIDERLAECGDAGVVQVERIAADSGTSADITGGRAGVSLPHY